MASPIGLGLAAAAFSLLAGSALACPDVAACGGMSAHYGYYTEQASFGPMADYPAAPDAKGANGRSKSYWEDHAVVYNGQHIISSTITKDRPY